ncbi:MAG TPA: alginate lyase family protein [Steroidobacteraceae bacterium]|nr:alginate lyase family protein [Steroidobacteraceae bacterium]
MNLAWAVRRLSAMSAPEVGYRIKQKLQASIEKVGLVADTPAPSLSAVGHAWVEDLPRQFEPRKYSQAADMVLAGHFPVFAMRSAQLGFPPQWNRDPKTGRIAPLVFGKTLDYRDEQLVGDIKYLWEPSRHAQLVTLAQAWHLTGNHKYAHGCRTLLESWFAQCPHRLGVHWTSSLEHAIRLLNWSFAWHLLGGLESPLFRGATGQTFQRRWLASIHQHCAFIASHLSRFSSANNHLLGELCGLFVAATTWPFWKRSRQWQRLSHDEFEEQALIQNYPDGANREQANWYHYEVAEMLLIAGLVARKNQADFSAQYWQRLQSMLDYVASIMDAGGHVPNFGDADDAIIAPLDPAPNLDVYRSLLATGAVLFDCAEYKFKAGACIDDKTRWFLGDAAADAYRTVDASPARLPVKTRFPDAGYYILGAEFETVREIKIVADAGPLGFLSIAAHGHADALSFTLSAGGRELLVDSGTFAYHTQKQWRDYFRGTSAHNTLRIDEQDQSVSGGNFLWTRHARARLVEFEESGAVQRWRAEHDGYERLRDPVLHCRELLFDTAAAMLTVVDDIQCRGSHKAELFWHFAESCEVTVSGSDLAVTLDDITMTGALPEGLEVDLYRGSESPLLGWISRAFDTRTAITTLRAHGIVNGPVRFVTQFKIQFAVPELEKVAKDDAMEVS